VPPEKLAEAPFDDARADLILQSNDKVHFRVFKIILSLASPIFNDMFSIPSPPFHDEVQVVPVSEHSTALDISLRHIYPVRTPASDGDTLRYASILAEFARKYQVEALDKSITDYLTESTKRDPVGVYAIAAAYGFNSIGANAAKSCLNLPFSDLQSSYLRCATAEHILELLRYHVACGEAASALASSNRTWFLSLSNNGIFGPQRGSSERNTCRSCSMLDFIPQTPENNGTGTLARKSGPRCLWNYLYRSALVLAHHPTAKAVTTEAFILKTNDCPSCAQSMRGDMFEVGVVLEREIKNAIERVRLSLYSLCQVCDVQWSMHIFERFPYPKLFPRNRAEQRPLQIDCEGKCYNGTLL
jgi:hypothetical protein